jgi:predicted transcriptional regulator
MPPPHRLDARRLVYARWMANEPSVYDVLATIGNIAGKRGDPYATRTEIAGHLGVMPDDISREGAPPTGLLGEMLKDGLIEESSKYAGYWRLTGQGQTWLDSAIFGK